MSTGNPRVFIGISEVAGTYRGITEGLTELGVRYSFVDLSPSQRMYGGPTGGYLVRLTRWLGALPNPARRISYAGRLLLLVRLLFSHDVFIFSFANSLLPRNLDLPLLKLFGKKIICQFHGSDSRPPYLDGSIVRSCDDDSIRAGIAKTKAMKRTVVRIDRYADVVIDMPTQGHFHDRPFVLRALIGLPNRPASAPARLPDQSGGATIRVVHGPSDAAAKGTTRIRAAVERVRDRGIPLELIELQRRTNAEVLDELSRCDFVIDQLYSDFGMYGFATEAAWFGKPAVVGGWGRELWQGLLPAAWIPPSQFCLPEDLEDAVMKLATDVAYRRELGKRAREFVETMWHPKQVAERMLRLVTEPIPPEMLFDPGRIRYWEGACRPLSETRQVVRAFVKQAGKESLQLADKPELEAQIIERSFESDGG